MTDNQTYTSSDRWNETIGTTATICTIGLFITGSQVCYRIKQNGSVGDIPVLPFLTTFTNCVTMFFYGLLVRNSQLIVVNAVGFILQACYLVVYLFYTPNKNKLVHQIIFVVVLMGTLYTYAFHLDSQQNTTRVVGFIGCFASVIMFGSPLSAIRSVIKTQSTESLSFPLCFAYFTVAFLWTVYGFLIGDNFVIVPNIIGSVLAFAQVSLFYKFPSISVATRTKLKVDLDRSEL